MDIVRRVTPSVSQGWVNNPDLLSVTRWLTLIPDVSHISTMNILFMRSIFHRDSFLLRDPDQSGPSGYSRLELMKGNPGQTIISVLNYWNDKTQPNFNLLEAQRADDESGDICWEGQRSNSSTFHDGYDGRFWTKVEWRRVATREHAWASCPRVTSEAEDVIRVGMRGHEWRFHEWPRTLKIFSTRGNSRSVMEPQPGIDGPVRISRDEFGLVEQRNAVQKLLEDSQGIAYIH
ncbi:hypothetical protein DFH06DRAFT_1123925 [Mycena polygramma]|nr:hypothetical protein DFH06DRAFT_1123925 [Mycena polygramma]